MEYVVYDGEPPAGCPEDVWSDLCRTGLPRVNLNIFTPTDRPGLVSVGPDRGPASGIILGHSRENVDVCLEFDSGDVLLLWPQAEGRAFVNSSLGAFRESLVQVDARYPFYPSGRDLDMADEAERTLRDVLMRIDQESLLDPDGYWSAFLDDVAVGDYAAPS